MIKQSPTALNKRGDRVVADEIKFDSVKEFNFYDRFVKDCGYDFVSHPKYMLQELAKIDGVNISAISYKPDFVIYDDAGKIMHVYDVKNSLGQYGIDQGCKLRFRLFAAKYGIPVEAVVVRKCDFKVIAQGVTKSLPIDQPLIKHNFNYHWLEATRH